MNKSTLSLAFIALMVVIVMLLLGLNTWTNYQTEQSQTATANIYLTQFVQDESECYQEIPERTRISDFIECMRTKGHFPTITPIP